MSRLRALLILIGLWALVYLPGLGSTEIKGEEGRRILPAVTMLETGNWLVPYVGGEPYLRKPPLVNWLIAISFKITGVRNEWTARLPSALSVLLLGAFIVMLSGPGPRRLFTTDTAFIAALMVMTSFGILAKARFAGAEIDGVYVALAGLAMVSWLAGWRADRSPWLVWPCAAVFLGLGLLAKGPLHLLFFYAVAAAVLWQAREWRWLRHPAHFVALGLMLGIFASWGVPYFQAETTSEAGEVWSKQFAGRVTGSRFDWRHWLLNIPRSLMDQLPWLLFLPVLWRRRHEWTGRDGAWVRGSGLAVLICFFGLLLIPGVLPRYVLPLGVPFALLLAMALNGANSASPRAEVEWWKRVNGGLALGLIALAMAAPVAMLVAEKWLVRRTGARMAELAPLLGWPLVAAAIVCAFGLFFFLKRRAFSQPAALTGVSTALLGCGLLLYAAAAVPFINRADDIRPLAAAIDAAIPAGQRLVLCDPGYEPAFFYLRTSHAYVSGPDEIPSDARFVLVRAERRKKLERSRPDLVVSREFGEEKNSRLLLLQRREGI
ncbi:MAG: glycosyltransferase family 39 protein [Verrucomicrobiota bacterium]|nr:glycosyltransferase family 39 protein [Verrucomicrobiota bacterium]